MQTVLAAQTYTIREQTRTPKQIAASMRRLREIGYRAVQLSALGPIDTKELKAVLDGEGLIACATHYPYERLRDETEAVIEEHLLLECRYVGVGSMPREYREQAAYSRFARDASAVARRLAEAGLKFVYHNHSFELERQADGRTGLAILYEESDPEVFLSEIDTYWIQHGGGDPAQWIRRLAGRAPVVHLKDMAVDARQEQRFAEVGEGNMNWPAILEACRSAGTEWHVVEQDVCPGDPFESLRISLRNLQAMGLQ